MALMAGQVGMVSVAPYVGRIGAAGRLLDDHAGRARDDGRHLGVPRPDALIGIYWLAVKPANPAAEAAATLDGAGLRLQGPVLAPGWLRAESGRASIEWRDLDPLAGVLADRLGGPVLAGWVYDSDYGYVVAAEPSTIRARLVGG